MYVKIDYYKKNWKLPLLQYYKYFLSNRIAFNLINKDQTGKFYMTNFCDTFMRKFS